jgi:hypothetical protein
MREFIQCRSQFLHVILSPCLEKVPNKSGYRQTRFLWLTCADNIATPLASSFGDLLTLIILTFLTSLLVHVISTYWATALLILLTLAVPGFIVLVWKNPYVSELLFEGWTATILSTIISR